jgi:predicted MFS family arabinose efflux permease
MIIRLYRDAFSGLSTEVWLLSLVNLINRAGTMVIPFMTIYLTAELHFSLAQAGMAMACFGVGSFLGAYLGGRLTDTIGYYATQWWTLLLSGFLFMLLGKMHSFEAICACIFVLSVVADAFRPANYAAVAAYSPPEHRTRSYSLLRLAINLGVAAGPALGGWIAHLKGYQWLFWVDGITCMSAALFLRLLLRPKQDAAPSLKASRRALPSSMQSAYKDGLFLAFILLYSLIAIAFMQFFFTIPVFYKSDFGFDEGRIGFLIGLNGLLVALVEMPLVFYLEQRVNKLAMVRLGALFLGSSFLLYVLFPPWMGLAMLAVALMTLGEIFAMPFANALSIDRSQPHNRGQYMALYTMTYSAALVIAPTSGLRFAEAAGFQALMFALFLTCMIAFAGLSLLSPYLRRLKPASPTV